MQDNLEVLAVVPELILNSLNTSHMYLINHYVVDWGKVKTQEDLITILKGMDLAFEYPSEELKKLCKFVNKYTGEEVKI